MGGHDPSYTPFDHNTNSVKSPDWTPESEHFIPGMRILGLTGLDENEYAIPMELEGTFELPYESDPVYYESVRALAVTIEVKGVYDEDDEYLGSEKIGYREPLFLEFLVQRGGLRIRDLRHDIAKAEDSVSESELLKELLLLSTNFKVFEGFNYDQDYIELAVSFFKILIRKHFYDSHREIAKLDIGGSKFVSKNRTAQNFTPFGYLDWDDSVIRPFERQMKGSFFVEVLKLFFEKIEYLKSLGFFTFLINNLTREVIEMYVEHRGLTKLEVSELTIITNNVTSHELKKDCVEELIRREEAQPLVSIARKDFNSRHRGRIFAYLLNESSLGLKKLSKKNIIGLWSNSDTEERISLLSILLKKPVLIDLLFHIYMTSCRKDLVNLGKVEDVKSFLLFNIDRCEVYPKLANFFLELNNKEIELVLEKDIEANQGFANHLVYLLSITNHSLSDKNILRLIRLSTFKISTNWSKRVSEVIQGINPESQDLKAVVNGFVDAGNHLGLFYLYTVYPREFIHILEIIDPVTLVKQAEGEDLTEIIDYLFILNEPYKLNTLRPILSKVIKEGSYQQKFEILQHSKYEDLKIEFNFPA